LPVKDHCATPKTQTHLFTYLCANEGFSSNQATTTTLNITNTTTTAQTKRKAQKTQMNNAKTWFN